MNLITKQKTKFNHLLDMTINLGLFLAGALPIVVHSGYMVSIVLLTLIALPFLFRRQTYTLTSWQRRIVAVFLFYFAIQAFSTFTDTHWSARNFDVPSRAIMGVVIFLLLIQRKLSFLAIGYGTGLGAILGVVLAVYQKFYLGYERAFSDRMPIQIGDISMTLGLISLCFLFYFIKKGQTKSIVLFSIATLSGLMGSLLSGSRGGWILLPVILVVFFIMHRDYLTKKAKLYLSVSMVCILLISLIPQVGVTKRIHQGYADLYSFYTKAWQGGKGNSLGTRLLLWENAIDSIKEKPLLGWGKYGIDEYLKAKLAKGEITKNIYQVQKYSHAHNQFLQELMTKGLLGLIAFLGILLVPLRVFRKAFINNSLEVKAVAASGVMLVLSSIDYCLSQAFFMHNSGMSFYMVFMAILLGVVLNNNTIKIKDNLSIN